MAIVEATISAGIKAIVDAMVAGDVTKKDPNQLRKDLEDGLAKVIKNAIKSATVTVPGTGLVAPSGGGPVTGSSVTGGLT